MDNRVKTDNAKEPNSAKKWDDGKKTEHRKKLAVRVAVLVTAIGFIWFGAVRGEAGVVLNKAVNICFECIGLG